MSLKCFLRK